MDKGVGLEDSLILINFIPQDQKPKFSTNLYNQIAMIQMQLLMGKTIDFYTLTRISLYT